MQPLKPEDRDVLAQYDHAYDGLVRSIRIDFPFRTSPTTVEVVLLVCKAGDSRQWVYLRFLFSAVSDFKLSEGNVTYRVLIDGARLVWKEGKVTLDMDPGPDGIDNPIPGHSPAFFVTGEECSWEETPYGK